MYSCILEIQTPFYESLIQKISSGLGLTLRKTDNPSRIFVEISKA
jgi:hypothetical protein